MIAGTPILLYHRVGPHDGSRMDRYTVSPGRFRAQMDCLAALGWNVITLDALLSHGGRVSSRRNVVITFDDGFASNREHAWPVLRELRFASTTFMVASQVGGTNAWDDANMPRYPLLAESDLLCADQALMSFHSHASTHCDLTSLNAADLKYELGESRHRLEALAGRPVTYFAYPFGAWNHDVKQAVSEAGYRAACSCRDGLNRQSTDPFLLRRVEMREADTGLRVRFKLSTGYNFG